MNFLLNSVEHKFSIWVSLIEYTKGVWQRISTDIKGKKWTYNSLKKSSWLKCKRYSTTNNEALFNFHANIHNIRNFQEVFTENRKIVKYGIETVTYRAPFLWANLQSEYKNAKSLEEFKSKIKTWKCDFCSCRFCK